MISKSIAERTAIVLQEHAAHQSNLWRVAHQLMLRGEVGFAADAAHPWWTNGNWDNHRELYELARFHAADAREIEDLLL